MLSQKSPIQNFHKIFQTQDDGQKVHTNKTPCNIHKNQKTDWAEGN